MESEQNLQQIDNNLMTEQMQAVYNGQMQQQGQMPQQGQMTPLEQSMQNGFVPVIPIAFDKEFTLYLLGMSFLFPLIGAGVSSQFMWQLLSFVILIMYTVSFSFKLRRKGIKLSGFGCIITDIVVCIGSTILFMVLAKNNIVIAIAQSIIWTFECMISQVIAALIIHKKTNKQFKIMKIIEKQRKQYERKLDKIYGKGKH